MCKIRYGGFTDEKKMQDKGWFLKRETAYSRTWINKDGKQFIERV